MLCCFSVIAYCKIYVRREKNRTQMRVHLAGAQLALSALRVLVSASFVGLFLAGYWRRESGSFAEKHKPGTRSFQPISIVSWSTSFSVRRTLTFHRNVDTRRTGKSFVVWRSFGRRTSFLIWWQNLNSARLNLGSGSFPNGKRLCFSGSD